MNNKKKNNIDGIKKKSISSIKKVSKRSAPEVEIKRESSVSNTEAIRRSRKYNIKKVSRVDVDPSLPVQKRLNKRLPPLKEVNFASNKKKKTPKKPKLKRNLKSGVPLKNIKKEKNCNNLLGMLGN